MYEQAQGAGAAGPDMDMGAGAGANTSNAADDDVVDGEYKEVQNLSNPQYHIKRVDYSKSFWIFSNKPNFQNDILRFKEMER